MIVNEDNFEDEEYIRELIGILAKEQIFVGSGCIPLQEYLREKHFHIYKKYKDQFPDSTKQT